MQIQGLPEAYVEHGVTAGKVLLVIAIVIAALALYLLPSIVGRRRPKAGAITRINVLLGWTVIGWIVAMRWAMTADES
jgi:hypothetical protein